MVLASLINRAANAVIRISGAWGLLAVNDPAENRRQDLAQDHYTPVSSEQSGSLRRKYKRDFNTTTM